MCTYLIHYLAQKINTRAELMSKMTRQIIFTFFPYMNIATLKIKENYCCIFKIFWYHILKIYRCEIILRNILLKKQSVNFKSNVNFINILHVLLCFSNITHANKHLTIFQMTLNTKQLTYNL